MPAAQVHKQLPRVEARLELHGICKINLIDFPGSYQFPNRIEFFEVFTSLICRDDPLYSLTQ